MITIPRLSKGTGYKGPEFYGCYNTGMAPAIFHSRTGKYVVGPELPARDVMRAGTCLLTTRVVKCADARRYVWIYKGRKAAVTKFLALAGAVVAENAEMARRHAETRTAAARGDLAAALALGDF
jgi:hypothetical protein